MKSALQILDEIEEHMNRCVDFQHRRELALCVLNEQLNAHYAKGLTDGQHQTEARYARYAIDTDPTNPTPPSTT